MKFTNSTLRTRSLRRLWQLLQSTGLPLLIAVKAFALVNFFLYSFLCTSHLASQVVDVPRKCQSLIANHQSVITHCQTFGLFLLPTQSLSFFFLHSTLPYTTLEDSKKPLVATVIAWKHMFDAPSIRLSRATSIVKLTATSDTIFDAYALDFFFFLGGGQLRLCTVLAPRHTESSSKWLQKPSIGGASYSRRKLMGNQ